MKAKEFLIERATSILFHYTSIESALTIVKSGVFQLSSITGNKSEELYAPPGHPFFLSLTRTSHGDYHKDEDDGLGNDLSNARKPGAADRESAVKLIKYMQLHHISTVQFKNQLTKKWVAIADAKNKKQQPDL